MLQSPARRPLVAAAGLLLAAVAAAAPPPVLNGAPAAGQRVRVTAPEYAGTDVYHTLYLPTDWTPGGTYPVIVEFAPNKTSAFAGSVEDTHLGYYQSGGQGFIWATMPSIKYTDDPDSVATTWWGNGNADDPIGQSLCAAYTITNLVRILETYGGDPASVFVTGFSRGAIACGYIGCSTEELADIWLGFLPHSHTDFGWFNGDAASSTRTGRVSGRGTFVTYGESDSGDANSREGVDGLTARGFPVESYEIAGTEHTDEWITDAATPIAASASYTGHAPVSDVRARMRAWMAEVATNKPGTHSIGGLVTDANGTPVSGVRLQSGSTHWTFSGEDGGYELAGLIDGPRTLTVAHLALTWDTAVTNLIMAGANVSNVNFVANSVLPPIALSNREVATNALPGTLVGTLSMTSTNGTGFAYALDPGGNTTHFQIVGSNLQTKAWMDAASYDISVIGSKGAFSVTTDIPITVTSAPNDYLASIVAAEVSAAATGGETVGVLQARATDASVISYTLTGGRTDLFEITDTTNLTVVLGADLDAVGSTHYLGARISNAVATNDMVIKVEVVKSNPRGFILLVR